LFGELKLSQLAAGVDVCRGKYRLIRLLGAGGFAQVFEAENVATKRRVALKAVLAEEAGPEVVERLRREAVVSSRVRHPNVVDVYDLEEENGIWFLVMEYVRGETLRQALDRTRLSLDISITLLSAVMRGLSVMHRQGVVHRDIKPENIYLAHQDDSTQLVPKLLDFGICKVAQPDPELPPLTRAGTHGMGTALYMSPEQYADSASVDARADVYAMGVVLYECIAGHTPFYGASQRDLLLKMLTTNAPPVTALRPELPSELDGIVAKAMAKDAAERFQSIDELVDVLLPFAATSLPSADTILAARSSQLPPVADAAPKKTSLAWVLTLTVLIVAQMYGLYWAATALHGASTSSVFSTHGVLAGFFLPERPTRAPAPAAQRAPGADAAVELVCDIPGAELYVNGERIGAVVSGSPIHLSLPPGLYRFEAMRDGAVVASDLELVQPGSNFELHLRSPATSEPLQVNAPAANRGAALVSTAPREPEETDVDRSLSHEQLSDVIKSHLDSLQRCYEAALMGQAVPSQPTSMQLSLSIAARGDVTEVHTDGDTLPGLDACFEKNARSWVFPQAAQATQLRFPLVFRRAANTQLTAAQLTTVLAQRKGMLQRCYSGSDQSGRVLKLEVDMEVSPSGAVSSVEITGDAPGVDACIARTVRSWQFPTAVEATHTRFPLLLLPGA
jgi:eukaryotic-like serine/threonine-protein kinase